MNAHALRRRLRAGATIIGTLALAGAAIPTALASDSGGIGPEGDDEQLVPAGAGDGVFPVRGRHSYGDGVGAGRNHQGQDLIAKCGKPVVAAQSGRVVFKKYQARACNYVVIDGARKAADTVYMHLARPASVRRGQRVSAGEQIGVVGTTGRSSTCHLHFEMWSAPGWYDGGKPIDPKPYLRRWDRTS